MGWCKLGAGGARAVSDLLLMNSTLTTLDLRGNALGNDGAIILSRGMKQVRGFLCDPNQMQRHRTGH